MVPRSFGKMDYSKLIGKSRAMTLVHDYMFYFGRISIFSDKPPLKLQLLTREINPQGSCLKLLLIWSFLFTWRYSTCNFIRKMPFSSRRHYTNGALIWYCCNSHSTEHQWNAHLQIEVQVPNLKEKPMVKHLTSFCYSFFPLFRWLHWEAYTVWIFWWWSQGLNIFLNNPWCCFAYFDEERLQYFKV